MSLRFRILAILLIIFVAYAAVDMCIETRIIKPSFAELEQDMAIKDLKRCVAALKQEIVHLDRFAYDWAVWDDMYRFVSNGNQAFITANLTPLLFKNEKIDLFYMYNRKGDVVWGQIREHSNVDKQIFMSDFPLHGAPKQKNLLLSRDVPKSQSGIILTDRGAMLLSVWPILTSQEKGPSRGTLIVGRILDEEMVETLSHQTHVNISIWPFRSHRIPVDDRAYMKKVTPRTQLVAEGKDPYYLYLYTAWNTLSGSPGLFIRAKVPREITEKGSETTRFSFYSFLAIGSVVLVVMLLLIQGTIIKPIQRFTEHAVEIGGSSDLSRRLPVNRHDEFGRLAKEFNSMLEKLAETRRELLDQSYNSGMSDLAAGVLHNVRNALSPLTVLTTDLHATVSKINRQQMQIALQELQNDSVSEQRRSDLMRYLELSLKQVNEMCNTAISDVETIKHQVIHIEEIITAQESYSQSGQVVEEVKIVDLAREAVEFMGTSLQSSMTLEVDKSVVNIEPFHSSRIALLQVMANLFKNAVEAGRNAGKQHTVIRIDDISQHNAETNSIHLRFMDDGPGIAAEVLPHIFDRGFTTKENRKLSGLGLHWSANTMIAMGGRLYAENRDDGTGACFHLIIPQK